MSERYKQSRPKIPTGSIQKLVRLRTARFNEDVEALASSLFNGRITLRFWEEEMRTQLRLFHTGMTAIGAGGWGEVESRQWGRAGAIIKEQYRFLHGFAQDIADRRETISEKMIAARARMYGAKGTFTANVAQAVDLLEYLPWMPRDGSTTCINGCKCHWSLTASAPIDGVKTVTAVWTLTPAEHCRASAGKDGCIERNGFTTQFEVLGKTKIPAMIGAS